VTRRFINDLTVKDSFAVIRMDTAVGGKA
jgi:hypothetical protein